MKKRALISVSNKEGIVDFAKELIALGVEIISTGGTKKLLQENGLSVKGIEEITGFPEILDGRVKTLHPNVHGGLLAVRDDARHMQQISELDIELIDFVIVNLYPFKETISKKSVSFEEAIENIDIGGPTMIRSAAKNYAFVTVLVDPTDYPVVLSEFNENGTVSAETNCRLAAKVFRHTAAYDALIGQYLTEQVEEKAPEKFTLTFEKQQDLRYGENPHQNAVFYRTPLMTSASIPNANQLHGKELSYNNINDADTALQIVREFEQPTVVVVKHMNPCGVGVGTTIEEAFERAYTADPISIFGGIVACNREVDQATAKRLHEIFLEIIIAPSFSAEALVILKQKKNVRLLTIDMQRDEGTNYRVTSVSGGLLVQEENGLLLDELTLTVPTKRKPTEQEWKDLHLSWKVVKHVKSNAIVLSKNEMTIGVGAGQMNRVGAAKIAIEQAGDRAQNAVMGSDAFFPMPDTVEAAAQAGVTAIIQPGGSVKDAESIQKADEFGIAMVFTGIRHFKH